MEAVIADPGYAANPRCPADLLPLLLCPALCTETLTSADCVQGVPRPLAACWVQAMEGIGMRWKWGGE